MFRCAGRLLVLLSLSTAVKERDQPSVRRANPCLLKQAVKRLTKEGCTAIVGAMYDVASGGNKTLESRKGSKNVHGPAVS